MNDDDADDLAGRALARWQPPGAPSDFADRVLAARSAPASAAPRRARWVGATALIATAASVAVWQWPAAAPTREAMPARAVAERESIALGGRGIAVAEAGAALSWRRDGRAVTVAQTAGEVFYRVEAGGPFVVETPAATVPPARAGCHQAGDPAAPIRRPSGWI